MSYGPVPGIEGEILTRTTSQAASTGGGGFAITLTSEQIKDGSYTYAAVPKTTIAAPTGNVYWLCWIIMQWFNSTPSTVGNVGCWNNVGQNLQDNNMAGDTTLYSCLWAAGVETLNATNTEGISTVCTTGGTYNVGPVYFGLVNIGSN